MARSRCLASGTILCLTVRCPASRLSGSHLQTRCLIATFLASSPGLDIEEKWSYFVGDGNRVEQEGAGRVESPGGTICGVFRTRDISCVNFSTAIFRQLENTPEDVVGRFVGAAALPPPLDNPSIVAVEHDVLAFA